jgi:hypothetical protein
MHDEEEENFVVDLTNSHLHSLEEVIIPSCTKVRAEQSDQHAWNVIQIL